MKRWIIPLMVGIVALGTLTLAVPKRADAAGSSGGPNTLSAYCTAGQIPPGYGSSVAGTSLDTLIWNTAVEMKIQGVTPCSGGPYAHVSTFPGNAPLTWGITLNHDEVVGTLWNYIANGTFAAASFLCSSILPIPWWASVPICAAAFLWIGSVFAAYISAAATQTSYVWAFWCNPSPYAFCARNAQWSPWGWVVPVQTSGLNILFAFPMFPIGLQVNPTP
jgi:hypothetical protein